MPLDLRSIVCFEAAATLLNFRAAAEAVSLSPAAFSDRIRKLEDDLGTSLFDRSTRTVALTHAGLRLLPRARTCLEHARRCRFVVREEGLAAPFEVTIGTRYELGMSWLVPALRRLRLARPERQIHLYFGDTLDLQSRVERGVLDGMVSSVRLVQSALDYVPLHPESYVLVGAPGLLDRQPLSGPSDAPNHVLLDGSPNLPLFRYFLDGWKQGGAWAFSDCEYLGTIAAIRYRVLEQAGIAVLPEYFVREDLACGRLRRLFPEIDVATDAFRLVWRRGHRLSAELVALGKTLRDMPLR